MFILWGGGEDKRREGYVSNKVLEALGSRVLMESGPWIGRGRLCAWVERGHILMCSRGQLGNGGLFTSHCLIL